MFKRSKKPRTSDRRNSRLLTPSNLFESNGGIRSSKGFGGHCPKRRDCIGVRIARLCESRRNFPADRKQPRFFGQRLGLASSRTILRILATCGGQEVAPHAPATQPTASSCMMPSDLPFASSDFSGPIPFDFASSTRVVFGAGTSKRLGSLATELGGQRVLLVTDKGLAQAGHERHAVESLQQSGLQVTVFDEVHHDPTTDDVDRGLEVAREANINLIVGLGGGSSMDCAKGINFLLTNGGRMEDYWGSGKALKPMLPLIAVPTTAGTGSEAQSFAIIAHSQTHMKMACGDKKAAARIAILDPDLTKTMPPSVAAATGIDAISHAIESHVTTARTAMSQLFSRRAWVLLSSGVVGREWKVDGEAKAPHSPPLASNPQAARGEMLLGAHWAGVAIENSMLGATHSLANPLSAHFGLTHGIAIAVMLPHVIRFNASHVGRLYGELAADAGLCEFDDPRAGEVLADHLAVLAIQLKLPRSLNECGVTHDLLPKMATEAAAQWTAKFNPRPVDANSLRELYECAMS